MKILPNSSLAAFYVPEDDTRYIIYQAYSTGRLHAYCPIAGSIDGKHLSRLLPTYPFRLLQ